MVRPTAPPVRRLGCIGPRRSTDGHRHRARRRAGERRPILGASQRNPTLTVSFKVSRSGKRVSSLKVSPSLPNSCGYGGPPPTQTSKPAKIADGKFTAKITEKAGNGTVAARATITGRFLAKRKEKGTIKTSVPAATSCNGTFSYSTKVKKKG